jgi:uncharacterized glyoxalase superfamily protein PhnB
MLTMNPTFMQIAPVYPVDDVEASIEWYQEVLGFQVVYVNRDPEDDDPTNYAVIRRDQVTLHLVRRAEAQEGFTGRADAQFSIRGDIDALFESLGSHGVNILQPLRDTPWGCRDFIIADPSGNKIWISSP